MQERVRYGLDLCAAAATAVLMGLLFALVLAQVTVRALGISVPFTEELTRYILAALVPLACYPWPPGDADVVESKRREPRPLERVSNLVSLALIIVVLVGFADLASLGTRQQLATVSISIAWIYGPIFALLALSVVARILSVSERRA
ncbi:MAG TPA: hypothetical protein VEA61_12680 [Allosphingosinicella sp.]|nr:hypothetical protein [Allosphingosinicella sp.]